MLFVNQPKPGLPPPPILCQPSIAGLIVERPENYTRRSTRRSRALRGRHGWLHYDEPYSRTAGGMLLPCSSDFLIECPIRTSTVGT